MPCPHSTRGTDESSDASGVTRRGLLEAAVAIGGANALSACLEYEGDNSAPDTTTRQFPRGPDDPGALPESQHAWQAYLVHDRFGNTIFPLHQTLLFVDYAGDGTPTDEERAQVERGFETLERAFQRGTGGSQSARETEGLLFTVGYSPTYFDRFDGDLPDGVDLRRPEEVVETLGEDATPEHYDAVVHLASGYASVVLGAERALRGREETLNGLSVEGGFDGVLELAERRTGFIGKGQPSDRYDEDAIPDSSPLSMGFKAGFGDNLPDEDRVTIREGPFAGGTTQQVSHIDIDVSRWYGSTTDEERVDLVFTPEHDREDIGEFGENLAGDTGKTPATAESVDEDARRVGRLGHGQKLTRARDDAFRPVILRRDFDATAEPGMHFDSWQRGIGDFVATREAMNADEYADDLEAGQNGIVDYIDVTSRATFLVPPRSHRALPSPRP